MGTQPYKRQKFLPNSKSGVVPTKYEPAQATLKNFPSSIVNGITNEGGLFSLTFKSINCTTLVERLDLVRKTLITTDDPTELSRIYDQDFDARLELEKLKKEVEELKNDTTTLHSKEAQDIDQLNHKLQTALENKLDLSKFGEEIYNFYSESEPTKVLTFSNELFSVPDRADLPSIKVESFEDVKNPDYAPYQRDIEIPEEIITNNIDVPGFDTSNSVLPPQLSYPTNDISYVATDIDGNPIQTSQLQEQNSYNIPPQDTNIPEPY